MIFPSKPSNSATLSAILCSVCAILVVSGTAEAQTNSGSSGEESDRSFFSADEPAWVFSAAAGIARGPSVLPVTVDLGGPRALKLDGSMALSRGNAITVSLARQFWGSESDDGERRYPFRLELEGLRADIPRESIEIGVSSIDLSDDLRVSGGFANLLVRFLKTEHTRWWIGGGVGFLQQSFPDASRLLPGCGCLNALEVDSTLWRPKARIEWVSGEADDDDFAVFIEGAYSKLPEISSASDFKPVTVYDSWKLWTVTAGIRFRF